MENIRYISRLDKDYPKRLSAIADAPAGIYIKGKLPDDDRPAVAIVGSRICSEYGKMCAEEFAKGLAASGVQIISGLARGVDGIAQLAAAKAGGDTYGILGCGIDVVYPSQNKKIYEEVLKKGGIISEYPPGRGAVAGQFPARNRIISALCDILLVIEAKKRSGTSITVSRALEQGKDIYAIPGRLHDLCSEGCNELISNGAGIATGVDVILDALGIKKEENDPALLKTIVLDADERKVYELLEAMPKDIAYLQGKTGLDVAAIMSLIYSLIAKDLCREVMPGLYVKKL